MVEISLKAEELFRIGSPTNGFPITNSLLVTGVVLFVLILIGVIIKKKISLFPGKFQNFIEIIIEGFMNLMDSVLGSRQKSEKYLPFVFTIFLVVILSNWLGLLPGVGSIGIREVHQGKETFIPIFRAPSADLNFTVAIAILAVFFVNIFAVFALGVKRHFGKFFSVKSPISAFVGILEFISEFAKMVSFSFRLFGNIFAGEVLLIIVGFLVPYIVPLPFLFLEIFVGFIQAFVFAMLTLVFIAIATMEEAH